MTLLSSEPDGMTVKQLARRLGFDAVNHIVTQYLELLADKGDVVRFCKGAPRYLAKSPEKLLPRVIQQIHCR